MNFKSGDTQTDRQTNRQTDKQTYFISPCWTATFAVKKTSSRGSGQASRFKTVTQADEWAGPLLCHMHNKVTKFYNWTILLWIWKSWDYAWENSRDIFQDKGGQCRGNTNLIFIHSTFYITIHHTLPGLCITGWEWGLLIFLSQLSLGKSLLCPHFSQVDSSVQCERTAALYTCTVAASPDTHSTLTETDTLRTASLLASARPHSDPHTDSQYNNTSNISPQSRQLSNKFQWVESVFTRISLHHDSWSPSLSAKHLPTDSLSHQNSVCSLQMPGWLILTTASSQLS